MRRWWAAAGLLLIGVAAVGWIAWVCFTWADLLEGGGRPS